MVMPACLRWTVSTDPKVHLEAVRKLFESGASLVNIHSGQADQSKVVQFYGTNVLPQIRGSFAPTA